MSSFKAIVIRKGEGGQAVGFSDFDDNDLMDGDVTFRVEWSALNYKDGLAITGKAPVVRRFPMIPGIDGAGTVETSTHPDWKPGDKVILNGWGCGESHLGMYGAKARVKGDWLVPLPDTVSARDSMAIGTAGYTAMLCVLALERHGLTPASGPVIVTGAAGGVGSVAVALLSKLGFTVIAATGRPQEADYLRERPEYASRFPAVASYLATKVLVSHVRDRRFDALWHDAAAFRAAGLIDANLPRVIARHRAVSDYRREHATGAALAALRGAPEKWL